MKNSTIEAGNFGYKLTTIYNVSAKAICEANPGLSAENFVSDGSDLYSFRRRSTHKRLRYLLWLRMLQ